LLEGAAAFTVEGEDLLALWSAFKRRGVPDQAGLIAFRDQFNAKLLQAQLGSRLGEQSGKRVTPLKRTNVLTFLSTFSKRRGIDFSREYEWLCDAVHPSFGFGTAYVATQGVHPARTTFAADLARRTDTALTQSPKIEPTVAWAAADVLALAIREFLLEWPRIRWLIDDLGLTTGVAFTAQHQSAGRSSKPTKEAICPCGSGIPFGACSHSWGVHAEPPSAVTGA
jgi:hypothetical protein